MAATFSDSRSVYQILAQIERPDGTIDHLQLWSQLGIKSSLFREHPKADVFTLATETNQWKLIRLSDRWSSEWQYILFRLHTNGTWRFGGNVDFPDEHYETPVHEWREIGDRNWLVIGHIAGYGLGYYRREDVWYPLRTSLGACELRYFHDGRVAKEDGRLEEYTLVHQECGITNGKPVVRLLHHVTVKQTDETGTNQVVSQKDVLTRFVWSDEAMKFEEAKGGGIGVISP